VIIFCYDSAIKSIFFRTLTTIKFIKKVIIMNKEIEALDVIMDAMTEEMQFKALDNRFPYLFSKAYAYLKIGPEKYRKNDYFNMPPSDLDQDELDAVESGCKQILQGIGFDVEKPFTGLQIRGFNLLLDLMHFEPIARKSQSTKIDGKTCFLDEIKFKHLMDQSEIIYYNLVDN
jgi:hypothetical protein